MSGIYINGMDMPKSCTECKFFIEDSWCSIRKGGPAVWFCRDKRSIHCPLVAVPDHGRLIDADAVDYDDYWWNKHYSARDCKQAEKMIKEQPTIIPADKDGAE